MNHLKITGKTLEWRETSRGKSWQSTDGLFLVEFDRFGARKLDPSKKTYECRWQLGIRNGFESPKAAMQWCQDELDQHAREICEAEVELRPMHENPEHGIWCYLQRAEAFQEPYDEPGALAIWNETSMLMPPHWMAANGGVYTNSEFTGWLPLPQGEAPSPGISADGSEAAT